MSKRKTSQRKAPKRRSILPQPRKSGLLRSCGYSTKASALSRHRAINKCLPKEKSFGAVDSMRALERRLILISNKNKNARKILREDAQWLAEKRRKSQNRRRRS